MRSLGLGGEVYRRLGATPQTTSPGEILVSLQSGLVDGAEFVGPGSDIALGLYRVAPIYYGPGFNKPNGTGECIVSLKAWEALDADLKAIVAHACATEAAFALAEMERLNAEALAALIERHNVQLKMFPRDVVAAARQQATDVLAEVAGAQRDGAQGARQLRGVPRAHRGVVAHVDQGGAGGAGGGVGPSLRSGRATCYSAIMTALPKLRMNVRPVPSPAAEDALVLVMSCCRGDRLHRRDVARSR